MTHFFADGIFSAAYNTLFSGNRINVTDSYSGFTTENSIPGMTLHNISFKNNVVWSNASSSTSTILISYKNVSGDISGNTIIAKPLESRLVPLAYLMGLLQFPATK